MVRDRLLKELGLDFGIKGYNAIKWGKRKTLLNEIGLRRKRPKENLEDGEQATQDRKSVV